MASSLARSATTTCKDSSRSQLTQKAPLRARASDASPRSNLRGLSAAAEEEKAAVEDGSAAVEQDTRGAAVQDQGEGGQQQLRVRKGVQGVEVLGSGVSVFRVEGRER